MGSHVRPTMLYHPHQEGTVEPLRVAVIGCGNIAATGHLPAWDQAQRLGAARIVGVCDDDPAKAEALAEQYGVPAFSSIDELLATARPQVASIATPPFSHRDLTLRALDAGCHVLCEKPIAPSLADARVMVEAAERAGKLLSICFQTRFSPEVRWVREQIAAGTLGHIHAIRTWGGGPRGLPFGSQRHTVETNGRGSLQHFTIHNLDIALWLLLDAQPLTASAFCYQRLQHLPVGWVTSTGGRTRPSDVDPNIEDFATGMIRLAGGTVITLEANWMAPDSPRPVGWELLAEKSAVSIKPLKVLVDDGRDWIDRTPTLPKDATGMPDLMADFLARVRDGRPALVTGPEILRIQGIMDALYESDRTGHEVAL
jgi:predicted dehydrogenase